MSRGAKKVLRTLSASVVVNGSRVRLKRGDAIPAGIDKADRALLESRGSIVTKAQYSDEQETRETGVASPVKGPSVEPAETPETFDPASATDDQLIGWFEADGPTSAAVVLAAGENAELAARLLGAESAATGGNPRSDVVEALNAVIDGASSEPPAKGSDGGTASSSGRKTNRIAGRRFPATAGPSIRCPVK
jgi:hypothetical protein